MNKPFQRGARPLAELLNACLSDAFKQQGFASAELVTRWTEIVGPEIAAHAEPIKVQWPRAVGSDAPEPGLLAPGQAFFLRENLKLRLLNARLGLLSRDESTFREDIKTASAWLDRWFDARSKATQAAQASVRQLSSAAVQIQVPSIADSLNAVRNYKATRDRPR